MTAEKQALDFVRYILEQFCENKDSISLEHTKDDLGVLITIQIAEQDMGRLIGKQGQTISAIRTLVRVIGARENERINLKVIEPSA